MATQKDIKNRIASVKNIQKITRAMEMVAAARLRRAEQRIEALRPYADAIRRMTQHAAAEAEHIPDLPILEERESIGKVGILLVTGDRGLAGSFNSQIVRAGVRAQADLKGDGQESVFFAVGRRGDSSLNFRGMSPRGSFIGFTDRPAYTNAREIAERLMAAYIDGEVDRVDIVYNSYISALSQTVTRQQILPLQQAAVLEGVGAGEVSDQAAGGDAGDTAGGRDRDGEPHDSPFHALWSYEPEPGELLRRLIPDFVEITIFRALLESTASEHGARMTAMRSASENAAEMIQNLTLEANRRRQAEITQEIMEVVAGAEGLR